MVTTTSKKLAQGIVAGNFSKELKVREGQGYQVIDGEIVPKNYISNTDNLTSARRKNATLPAIDGGNYILDVDFAELDFTGANATLPALSVVGSKIRANGANIHLFGLSLGEADNHFIDLSGLQILYKHFETFPNANIYRIPCEPERIATYGVSDYIEYFVDPIVEWCERNEKYCIIDWHTIANWNTTQVDTNLKAFWDIVAPRYKDLPHVLYEIFNEPIGPTNGDESWADFKPTVQGWVNYVRALAPDNIILVPTPFYDQHSRFAVADQLTGTNLVYVEHRYPGHMPGGSRLDFEGNPVGDATQQQRLDWMDLVFGDPNEIAPVFLSEFGWDLADGGFYLLNAKSRDTFGNPMIDYMIENQVHGTFWSASQNAAPSMFVSGETGELKDMGLAAQTVFND